MASTFECPKCGRELKVPDELLGKKVKCPACQSVFITAAEEEPPAPKPAVPESQEGIIPSRAAPGATEEPTEEERPRKRARRWEDDYEEEEYGPRSRRRFSQRAADSVNGPATALMVTGIIGIVLGALGIGLHLLGIGLASTQAGARNEHAMANIFSGTFGIIQATLGIIIAVLIIVGTIKMKKLESYGFAMTVSILAMIPCISPCCLLGLPFGIWSIVVLSQPDVKDAFR